MVPTEVLAEQHSPPSRDAGRPRGPGLAPTSGWSCSPAGSRARPGPPMLDDLAERCGRIVVGTHALLTEEVEFGSLGMVVIDEQHRFGVEQRATLRAKGAAGDPDLLVMTATPIPRTAAMVIFGDLDLTVLDELPPGPGAGDHGVAARRRTGRGAGLGAGAPRGGRADTGPSSSAPWWATRSRVEAKSATEEFERLSAGELAGLRVGLLHGQMAPAAREEAMAQFRAGEMQVLVATTVIEVGVDVPEATVMVIESADRFGIAQLHQLRGRVGRGGSRAGASCSARREDGLRERLAAVAARPTASRWPRRTCACAARGRCWVPARRGRATCGWPRCPIRGPAPPHRGPAGGRGHRRGGPPTEAHRGPGRRDPAVPERGRGRVPVQELNRSRALGRDVGASHRRPEPGAAPGRQAPRGRAADVGPGARVDLRHPGLPGRGRGALGGRPVLRERRPRARGAVAGRRLGHVRRPGSRGPRCGADQPGRRRAG